MTVLPNLLRKGRFANLGSAWTAAGVSYLKVPFSMLHVVPSHDDLPHPGDWYPRLNDAQRKAEETDFESARTEFSEEEQRSVADHLRQLWDPDR